MIISDIAEKFVTVKDIALDFDPMRDFGITMNVNNMVVGVKFERDGLKTITAAIVLDTIELVVLKTELVTDFMTKADLLLNILNKFTLKLKVFLP